MYDPMIVFEGDWSGRVCTVCCVVVSVCMLGSVVVVLSN